MSRNGSGTQTTPNTFVAGTTITASDHNENWADVAAEITNSVAADGQTTMTGPLKAASGSAAAPSHTFGADTDTGAYRIGSDNYGIAVGGVEIVDVASTGMTVTGAVDATTVKQGGFALLPVGTFFPYAGSSAPSGFLLCTGQLVSRTTYAALFAVIGTAYGGGDGSTTFAVPDMGGRVPAGKEASASRLTASYFGGNSTTLGATGGLESHLLTTAQIPAVPFSGTTGQQSANHTHGYTAYEGGSVNAGGGLGGVASAGTTSIENAIHTHNFTGNISGGGGSHNNTQPTIITNYIIFAGV